MRRFWSYLGARVADMVAAAVQSLVLFLMFWFLVYVFGPTITLTTSKGAVIISTD